MQEETLLQQATGSLLFAVSACPFSLVSCPCVSWFRLLLKKWLLPSVSAWGELGQDAAWCPRLCLQSALPNAWAWPQLWTWRCLWPFFGWPCVWAPSSTRSWLQPLVEASLRDGRAGQGLTEQSCGLGSAQTCFLHWPVQEPKPYR